MLIGIHDMAPIDFERRLPADQFVERRLYRSKPKKSSDEGIDFKPRKNPYGDQHSKQKQSPKAAFRKDGDGG
jgi:hypothetical protein